MQHIMPVLTEVSTTTRASHSHSSSLPHIATQDLERASPTPQFEVEKPRGRRRSISPISSSSSTMPSSSKTMYAPPPLTWRNAFQDAKAGIHYTKDTFPTSTFLPPPFSREPVSVEPGDRVEILDEIDEYAVRVRVLRTGAVGLIPSWNTEGALERLTRINTAFNEAATCPVEARAMRRYSESAASSPASSSGSPTSTSPSMSPSTSPASPTNVSLTHIHARCVPYATRVRFPDYYGMSSPFSDDDSDDSDSPLSPPDHSHPHTHTHAHERERGRATRPAVYEAQPGTIEEGGIVAGSGSGAGSAHGHEHGHEHERSESGGRRKSVNFAVEEKPQVVFRYPSEELVGAMSGGAGVEESEEDEEWWWQGWEEMCVDGQQQLKEQQEHQHDGQKDQGKEGTRLETVEEEDVFPFVFFEDDDEA